MKKLYHKFILLWPCFFMGKAMPKRWLFVLWVSILTSIASFSFVWYLTVKNHTIDQLMSDIRHAIIVQAQNTKKIVRHYQTIQSIIGSHGLVWGVHAERNVRAALEKFGLKPVHILREAPRIWYRDEKIMIWAVPLKVSFLAIDDVSFWSFFGDWWETHQGLVKTELIGLDKFADAHPGVWCLKGTYHCLVYVVEKAT